MLETAGRPKSQEKLERSRTLHRVRLQGLGCAWGAYVKSDFQWSSSWATLREGFSKDEEGPNGPMGQKRSASLDRADPGEKRAVQSLVIWAVFSHRGTSSSSWGPWVPLLTCWWMHLFKFVLLKDRQSSECLKGNKLEPMASGFVSMHSPRKKWWAATDPWWEQEEWREWVPLLEVYSRELFEW